MDVIIEEGEKVDLSSLTINSRQQQRNPKRTLETAKLRVLIIMRLLGRAEEDALARSSPTVDNIER